MSTLIGTRPIGQVEGRFVLNDQVDEASRRAQRESAKARKDLWKEIKIHATGSWSVRLLRVFVVLRPNKLRPDLKRVVKVFVRRALGVLWTVENWGTACSAAKQVSVERRERGGRTKREYGKEACRVFFCRVWRKLGPTFFGLGGAPGQGPMNAGFSS